MVLYRGCTEGCGSIYGDVQRDVVLYRGVLYRGMWVYISGVYRGIWVYIGVYRGMKVYILGCTEG